MSVANEESSSAAKKAKKAGKRKEQDESAKVEAALPAAKKEKKTRKKKVDDDADKVSKKKKRTAEDAEQIAEQPPKKVKKEKGLQSSPPSDASEDTAVQGTDGEAFTPRETQDPANPLAVDNFPLSKEVKAALQKKQIKALFDIQAQTMSHVLDGKDLLGRARTGCGKTLAFVLPLVETLGKKSGQRPAFGRFPRVIVLAPTRELAKQECAPMKTTHFPTTCFLFEGIGDAETIKVHADFEWIGNAFGLRCVCIYGGSPYGPQEGALRRGTDVVVGTPGRVKDMLEKGVLKLSDLQFRVLDECDEMLNMGFVDDVEKILKAGGSGAIQTLLFSATLPSWVKDIQKRFLKPDFKLVDLVGNERQKASTSVRHLLLPCHWSQRASVTADCVRAYGAMGRTIVFTDTKKEANELTSGLEAFSAKPLHGDIPQSTRETTLAGFRAGSFKVLVATDVAARGLDISGVELVLQCEPPKDPENYIHRSGRTGRAGCTGISLTLVDRKKEGLIPFIERRAGFKFERIGAPQPADMAALAGTRAAESVKGVDGDVVPYFREAARSLLDEYSDPEEALARALAKITGHVKLQARSLMTSHEDYTTLMFHNGSEIQKPGLVWAFLKRRLSEDVVEEVKSLTLTADNQNAVFDVPSKRAAEFLSKAPAPKEAGSANIARGIVPPQPYLTQPSKLPELKQKAGLQGANPFQQGGRFGGGNGRGGFSEGRRDFGGGGSRSGGRFGGSGGFGKGRGGRKF